jgi:hypothetical protein
MQRLGGLCGYRFVVLVELDVQQLEGFVVKSHYVFTKAI